MGEEAEAARCCKNFTDGRSWRGLGRGVSCCVGGGKKRGENVVRTRSVGVVNSGRFFGDELKTNMRWNDVELVKRG